MDCESCGEWTGNYCSTCNSQNNTIEKIAPRRLQPQVTSPTRLQKMLSSMLRRIRLNSFIARPSGTDTYAGTDITQDRGTATSRNAGADEGIATNTTRQMRPSIVSGMDGRTQTILQRQKQGQRLEDHKRDPYTCP
eukprot:413559-Pleurochrysis_carterae.AAC.1